MKENSATHTSVLVCSWSSLLNKPASALASLCSSIFPSYFIEFSILTLINWYVKMSPNEVIELRAL